MREGVCLVREPDAGNLHVRFDERGVETELWRGYLGTARRKGRQQQTEPNATAPHSDSTVEIPMRGDPIKYEVYQASNPKPNF